MPLGGPKVSGPAGEHDGLVLQVGGAQVEPQKEVGCVDSVEKETGCESNHKLNRGPCTKMEWANEGAGVRWMGWRVQPGLWHKPSDMLCRGGWVMVESQESRELRRDGLVRKGGASQDRIGSYG